MNKPTLATRALGQRLWLDNLARPMLQDGSLERLIREDGIAGVTSNPSIFQKAIAARTGYEDDLMALAASDLSDEACYEQLAIKDIRAACDLLRPQWHAEDPLAGWVSLEVSPALAHDTAGTIAAARRLHAAVDRPNLMIKVPATLAGLPAIRHLIALGLAVNVTLIFSRRQLSAVRAAYQAGIRDRLLAGQDVNTCRSVASLFLSRIDTLVDTLLTDLGSDALRLRGQTALANAKVAYAEQQQAFAGEHWQRAREAGAHPQYLLFASTGCKNPAYPDTLYVNNLIGDLTVNTLPDAALHAFRDHGVAQLQLTHGQEEARSLLQTLASLGIELDRLGETLQADGLKLFNEAYLQLLTQMHR